ncbi:MAG: DNA adenine methylase, partial [Bacteroidales bacterium]|nr:DNA adenine methylase [Bacteroidales bacterium]
MIRYTKQCNQKTLKEILFSIFFSGTANVGKFFKKLNYQVYSSDLLYFSYVLQQAYIKNNEELYFEKLLNKLSFQSRSLFASPLYKVVEYL